MLPKIAGLDYAAVAAGGAMGAALRHGVNRAVQIWGGLGLPYATFLVNVLGCLAIGLLAGWFALRGESTGQTARLFLATGILGGFTTFSAFTLDVVLFWQRAAHAEAALYVFASVLLSIAAAFAGLAIMRAALS